MAALPPISSETYRTVFASSEDPDISIDSELPEPTNSDQDGTDAVPSDFAENLPALQQCIFCLAKSDEISHNIEHMAASHGLVLPDLQKLETDVDTFISYLGLVAVHYCECLFCGATKRSAEAARAHMLAKGHCMLDLSTGSEFLEFWASGTGNGEDSDSLQRSYQLLSVTEMRLSSGAIASSWNDANTSVQKRRSDWPKRAERTRAELTTLTRPDAPSDDIVRGSSRRQGRGKSQEPCRTLATRDQMGLIGLSNSQRRSLAVAQRKIDLSALRARNKAQWTLEKMGNKVKQKHFVVGPPCRTGWFLDPCVR